MKKRFSQSNERLGDAIEHIALNLPCDSEFYSYQFKNSSYFV